MNEIQITYREFYIYVLIGGAILGALFGLIPLVLGRRRHKGRLGLYGFVASIVAGAIAPLLGIIIATIFSWVIVKGTPAQADSPNSPRSDDSADSTTE